MADQHHDSVPATGNTIAADIPDIAETTNFHKDCIEAITGGWSDTATTYLVVGNRGLIIRAQFLWKDADEIYLNAGAYHSAGATNQMVYWSSQLTFKFGSAGSNANSEDLGATENHYLYIDDSSLSSNVITNANLINTQEVPAWSDTKYGWYGPGTSYTQTNDRCIFAIRTNASSQIREFFHDGGSLVMLSSRIEERAAATCANDFSDEVTLSIPAFCRRAVCQFEGAFSTSPGIFWWRTEGQSDTSGHRTVRATTNTQEPYNTCDVFPSSNLKIDVKDSTNNEASTLAVYLDGWHLPVGM